MSSVDSPRLDASAPAAPAPRRFSIDEYHRLIDAGILHEDERIELVEGVVVQMSPQKERHMRALVRLTRWLTRSLGDEYEVRPQGPLTLADSEPEPDVAVVRVSPGVSADAHPAHALLVIEVSDSSLSFDRTVKARVYARARIPEYWIVNLADRCVEVRRDPDPAEGRYRSVTTLKAEGALSAASLPCPAIPTASLFD
jgi:Uma2 family endonuclease